MPMDFPDLKSLKRAARVHGFREFQDPEFFKKHRMPGMLETEKEYRESLADHVRGRDVIESGEIRFGVGRNLWTDEQKRSELRRSSL